MMQCDVITIIIIGMHAIFPFLLLVHTSDLVYILGALDLLSLNLHLQQYWAFYISQIANTQHCLPPQALNLPTSWWCSSASFLRLSHKPSCLARCYPDVLVRMITQQTRAGKVLKSFNRSFFIFLLKDNWLHTTSEFGLFPCHNMHLFMVSKEVSWVPL